MDALYYGTIDRLMSAIKVIIIIIIFIIIIKHLISYREEERKLKGY